MKFACISDLHGHLPEISKVDFDCLLVGGDICPLSNQTVGQQKIWIDRKFRRWLNKLGRPVIGVAGNHDFVFESNPHLIHDLPWNYLQDSGIHAFDLKIWGSPWSLKFCGSEVKYKFSFVGEEEELRKKWSLIPEDTNVLIVHGPPRCYGDYIEDEKLNVGSCTLLQRIDSLSLKLVVCGHIHGGYGKYKTFDTIVVNASHVNEDYEPKNRVIVVEI